MGGRGAQTGSFGVKRGTGTAVGDPVKTEFGARRAPETSGGRLARCAANSWAVHLSAIIEKKNVSDVKTVKAMKQQIIFIKPEQGWLPKRGQENPGNSKYNS